MKVNVRGFLICPHCRKKTKTKVCPNTVLKNFPLWCPRCGRETIVNKE